jgi:hypothetical protein
LIGCTIAIGLRYGQGKECIPKEDPENRDEAIREVSELFRDFIEQFGDGVCRELIHCDLSNPKEQERYMEQQIYKDTCFKFFKFIMNRFIEEDKLKSES